ncbi:polysaccharide deacetylase family protein [Pollutibacter soli]|uniref:polysaccharide deacetylase family protein n=1 Tax=Pollutibacter soli TaxID=3034157 RepID=UPI0030139932
MTEELLLYSDATGDRIRYAANLVLSDLGGYTYRLTDSRSEFLYFNGPKINYSQRRITEDEFHIIPVRLLYESDIRVQVIDVFELKEYPAFFQSPIESNWPFDIFAAAFYLVSRYEEYLPFQPDEYGRFPHQSSAAFEKGFLHRPVVNEWVLGLKKKLLIWFPNLWSRENYFRFIPTYDIDIAYSYLHKGWQVNFAGALKSISKMDFKAVIDRIQVLSGNRKDPFDVYEWLYALHLKYRLKPVYFFLVAAKRFAYDRNILPTEKAMIDLILHHAMGYQIGIHPSWQSGDDKALFQSEKKSLEEISGIAITKSRQHYIRMTLPETYQQLEAMGIKDEYSMGYGSINGFRASISSPFPWYDLSKNKATEMMIHPWCFMDANSLYEQKYIPAQAYEELSYYHQVIKKVNGQMITIWHNNFFGTDPAFKGWREVYELFLNEVVYWDV